MTLAAALLLCGFSQAQNKTFKSIEDARKLSKETAELFREYKFGELFLNMKEYWPLPENELDDIKEKTIKYMNMLKDRYGDPIAVTKIKEQKIAEIAVREVYFIQYRYTAIRLIFTYYKNDKGWILNAFKWDDSFSQEFE